MAAGGLVVSRDVDVGWNIFVLFSAPNDLRFIAFIPQDPEKH